MAALSTLRGYVRDELGELTAGRWSDSQLNSWLNRGVDYTIEELYNAKCWKLLRKIIKNDTYTVPTSETEHSMWQIIDNKVSGGSATNTWYGYVHGMLGNYVLHQADMEEFHRLNATTGEFAPTTYEPWIVFTGYDRGETVLTYTSGSQKPAIDAMLEGSTDGATSYVAFVPPPTSGSFSGGDAAGEFYLRDTTGTWNVSTDDIDYYAPTGAAKVSDIGTTPAETTESHDNCPIFSLYPSLSSTASLKIWWCNKPTAMSAATDTPDLPYDCDNLIIWWATGQAWQADRNFDMADRLMAKYERELQKKIARYQEVVFRGL